MQESVPVFTRASSKRLARLGVVASAAAVLCACEGFTTWLFGAERQPVLHAGLPQVVDYGGPVLATPKIVPIFFESDAYRRPVEQFLSQLPHSAYWKIATREYGVGDVAVAPSVLVSELAPTTIDDPSLIAWLADRLTRGAPSWPAYDPNAIYVVFYPDTTEVATIGATGCATGSSAYHYEGSLTAAAPESPDAGPFVLDGGSNPSDARVPADAGGESPFAYAVVQECGTLSGPDVDGVTGALSHELVEAATDPFAVTNPAYYSVNDDHLAWGATFGTSGSVVFFSEVADLCNLEEGQANLYGGLVDGFSVQRVWSNAAAAASQDPCVPAVGDTYFNSAPDLDEDTSVLYFGETRPTKGIRVPAGTSRTVDVRLFSSAPRPDWQVTAYEITQGELSLDFSWNRTSGNDGDILELTIERLKDGSAGGSPFLIVSGDVSSGATNAWAGFAGNQRTISPRLV